jgi:hypothetical protein
MATDGTGPARFYPSVIKGFSHQEKVPNSCIESAEYIIQCIASNTVLDWEPGQSRKPHVFAHFGNGVTFNISNTTNFHNKAPKGLADFPFECLRGGLPGLGEGLICLNKTGKDLYYNMHLGGVVVVMENAGFPPSYVVEISNMMEPFNKEVKLVKLQSKLITTADQFRSGSFGTSAGDYALGFLTTRENLS